MNTAAHLLFVHEGASWYLPYALGQAEAANPAATITVLGGSRQQPLARGVPFAELESPLGQEFVRVYQHLSTHERRFELLCWRRWFYLLAYMQKADIGEIWYLDSDVLLYSSIVEMNASHGVSGTDCSFVVPRQNHESLEWLASGHISRWTRPGLERFCEFAIRSFSEPAQAARYWKKWRWHGASGTPGGICDMTGLYLFWCENANRVANLAQVRNQRAFDLSISTSHGGEHDQFDMFAGRKAVRFVNGVPMLRQTRAEPRLVRAHALHFQGAAKQYIPAYYRGADFEGKLRSDLSLKWRQAKAAARKLWGGFGGWSPARRSSC